MEVIYLVAGMSRRFGGNPKWVAKVGPNGESLIEYSVNQALKAGFDNVIFVVGAATENLFRDIFGSSYNGASVHYVRQDFDKEIRNRPWGTVDALCCAKDLIKRPFVVCGGDDIYGEAAFKTLAEKLLIGENVAIGHKVINVLSDHGTVNRGVMEVDSDGNVKHMKEVFNISEENLNEKGLNENSLCNMLIYGFQTETLDMFLDRLAKFKKKHEGDKEAECLIPPELAEMIANREIEVKSYLTEDEWMGLTNPEDEEVVRQKLLRKQSRNI